MYLKRKFLGTFAKLRKVLLASSCLSVCQCGKTRLPLDGFREVLYWSIFPKSVEEIRSIKIWQE